MNAPGYNENYALIGISRRRLRSISDFLPLIQNHPQFDKEDLSDIAQGLWTPKEVAIRANLSMIRTDEEYEQARRAQTSTIKLYWDKQQIEEYMHCLGNNTETIGLQTHAISKQIGLLLNIVWRVKKRLQDDGQIFYDIQQIESKLKDIQRRLLHRQNDCDSSFCIMDLEQYIYQNEQLKFK